MFRDLKEKVLHWLLYLILEVLFANDFDRTLGHARSSKWPSVRLNFLKSSPKCAVCGSTKNLNIHHVIPFYKDPTKELDVNNLITLCEDRCHILFGHLGSWRSWNETVVEDAKLLYNKIIKRP